LYTINRGNTGRPAGCQATIVHMVSTVAFGVGLGRRWAVSDGNASARHTSFYNDLDAIESLDWNAIRALNWSGRQHQKHAEFLVEDSYPFRGFVEIGCHNSDVVAQVTTILGTTYNLLVSVKPQWYY